jgi:hypothetical protein
MKNQTIQKFQSLEILRGRATKQRIHQNALKGATSVTLQNHTKKC